MCLRGSKHTDILVTVDVHSEQHRKVVTSLDDTEQVFCIFRQKHKQSVKPSANLSSTWEEMNSWMFSLLFTCPVYVWYHYVHKYELELMINSDWQPLIASCVGS